MTGGGISQAAPAEIGGYFGLELRQGAHWHDRALRLQSARACLLHLINVLRPATVWLPWFLCDSMVESVACSGIAIRRYSLREGFLPDGPDGLQADELFVCVNYFGLHVSAVKAILARYPARQVVVDNAQAFFCAPLGNLATLYSPRKFFGVPDGGYLATDISIDAPAIRDDQSLRRSSHLLQRIAHDAPAGLEAYRTAERSLGGQPPMKMSQLTEALLASIDYESVRERRNACYAQLDASLRAMNRLRLPPAAEAGAPLCYPLLHEAGAALRKALIAHRIYVPTYWQEVMDNPACPEYDRHLAANLVALPCDQRVGQAQAAELINFVLDFLRQHA